MLMERRRKKLGEILISQGLITEEQLLIALKEHKRTGISIGTVLVKLGFISDDDLSSVLGQQIHLDQKKRIGEVLLEQGLLTEEQLQAGLEEQRKTGMQLGKCLVNLGFISENKLVDVLSAQLDISMSYWKIQLFPSACSCHSWRWPEGTSRFLSSSRMG